MELVLAVQRESLSLQVLILIQEFMTLTTEQTVTLRQTLEESDLKLEGDLRRFNGLNIKRLNEINCQPWETTQK